MTTTVNLFLASPPEVRALMDRTDDPEVLRSLVKLEAAAASGDETERIEAIGELSDLRRGIGL